MKDYQNALVMETLEILRDVVAEEFGRGFTQKESTKNPEPAPIPNVINTRPVRDLQYLHSE
jgi:hypothetical protein